MARRDEGSAMQPLEGGFVLVDALAAMLLAAAVLAGLYSLISVAARSSGAARDTAYAAAAAHSLCIELAASGELKPGRIARPEGALEAWGEASLEPRPGLPPQMLLWRLDCTVGRLGAHPDARANDNLASETTYTLRAARRP